jgi:hypothetical protein
MDQRENRELNVPAQKFFDRSLGCDFSTTEFRFSAGKLDVLAYSRKDKCFHVAEGKLATRISSVGHAVGQLVAYISMLQESGFDFLDRISKGANLYLTDFVEFLKVKSIKVCFYIVLPEKQRHRILGPALLVLGNVGDFGANIGVLLADKRRCKLEKSANPIDVKIRRRYSRDEFLAAVKDRFHTANKMKGIEAIDWPSKSLVQFGEVNGNAKLHLELAFHRKKKTDATYSYETAFHLEWAKAWQQDKQTLKRANKIRAAMRTARLKLKADGYDFKYQSKWGKAWSRLHMDTRTPGDILDDDELERALQQLQALADALLPLLRKINWGRRRKSDKE